MMAPTTQAAGRSANCPGPTPEVIPMRDDRNPQAVP